jgi:hypothetical protein
MTKCKRKEAHRLVESVVMFANKFGTVESTTERLRRGEFECGLMGSKIKN